MISPISENSMDRAEIRLRWIAMREEYHDLVEAIPPAAFRRPTIDTRWSIAEILVHMIQTLEWMPRAIASIRKGKDFINLPIELVGFSNLILVKMMARKVTPAALLSRYDHSFNQALLAWDKVNEDEWNKGASLFGEGYKSLLDYYRHGLTHFREHADQVRKSLPGGDK